MNIKKLFSNIMSGGITISNGILQSIFLNIGKSKMTSQLMAIAPENNHLRRPYRMRRKDKQITDPNLIDAILSSNTICRLGLADGKIPYIVPMNYGYNNGIIYLHAAPDGLKIDLLKKNNNVCIEITDSIELIKAEKACGYGTSYRSVICTGKAQFLDNLKQKTLGLTIIMKQHTGVSKWDIPADEVSKIVILKIEIEKISGKISGFPQKQ